MKKIILTLYVFSTFSAYAQTIEKYYDYQFKKCEPEQASFFSLKEKTDTGWLWSNFYLANRQLESRFLCLDSACKIKNGQFIRFYPNGRVLGVDSYLNNKLNGIFLTYYLNGMIMDSGIFVMDKHYGTELRWYQNGYLADSTVYDSSGYATKVSWFDNGILSSAGKKNDFRKEGKWIYYHKNGQIAALESYHNDTLVSRVYYNEKGKKLNDSTSHDRAAMFKGGDLKWKKYVEKKTVFPSGYKLVNTNIVTVEIAVIIDEEGNIEDAHISIPFKSAFDSEALRVVKQSPKWLPAIRNNRRVKAYTAVQISFMQNSN